MNRRQFIPMLLGTSLIDVSKLNFSKNDVYLKKREIFSKIPSYMRNGYNDCFKSHIKCFLNPPFRNPLTPELYFSNNSTEDSIKFLKNTFYKTLEVLNINTTNVSQSIINNFIFPPINSKDDLKHYYENIEILEDLNKQLNS